MSDPTKKNRNVLMGIGNVYVETNYLGLHSGKKDVIEVGKEYRADSYETRLGGSVTNFIVQAKKLGARVGLIGKIGQDEAGEKLVKLLKKEGVATELIAVSSQVQTSVDTGIVFKHNRQNIQLVAGNANQTLSKKDINLNHPLFASVRAIYLGGVLKQEALYKDYPDLLREITGQGIRVFLDHGRIPVDITDEKRQKLLQSMTYVEGYLPNESELLGITDEKTLEKALEKALSLGPKFVVVKLGAQGCRLKTKNEDIAIPGYPIKVVSTVGAGDSFNAGFITQYLLNKSLRDCSIFANATAAIRVSQNQMPSTKEVKLFLRDNQPL